jgi:hypothetical protein
VSPTTSSSGSSIFAASVASSRALTARTVAIFSKPAAESAIAEETKSDNNNGMVSPNGNGLTSSGGGASSPAVGNGLTSSGGTSTNGLTSSGGPVGHSNGLTSSGGANGSVKVGPNTPSPPTSVPPSSSSSSSSSSGTVTLLPYQLLSPHPVNGSGPHPPPLPSPSAGFAPLLSPSATDSSGGAMSASPTNDIMNLQRTGPSPTNLTDPMVVRRDINNEAFFG